MGRKVPHKDTAPVKYAEAAKLNAGVKVSSVSTPSTYSLPGSMLLG
jgi:hypothetical protein